MAKASAPTMIRRGALHAILAANRNIAKLLTGVGYGESWGARDSVGGDLVGSGNLLHAGLLTAVGPALPFHLSHHQALIQRAGQDEPVHNGPDWDQQPVWGAHFK